MTISERDRFLLLFSAMLPILFVAQYVVAISFRDNENYSAAYDAVGNFPIGQAFFAHYANTGSVEPVYFALSLIMAKSGIDYTLFVFFINLLFTLSISSFLSSFRVQLSWLLLLSMVLLFSFYPLVFLSELHRLKLALMFLFVYLASLVRGGRLSAIKYFCLGVASHFQSFLMFGSVFLAVSGLRFLKTKAFYVSLLFLPLVFVVVFQKVAYYIAESLGGFLDTAAILFTISIFFLLFKRCYFFRSLLCGAPLFLASLIFGGGRINFILIFGFFCVGFYFVGTRKLSRNGRVTFSILVLSWCVYGSLLTRNYIASVTAY